MGQMLIRKLDDAIIAKLKARARENRTSAEEEARRALAGDVGRGDVEAVLARLHAVRSKIGRLPGPTSTEMLRWDRDRDERALFELDD
jgi:antitoxin FitA